VKAGDTLVEDANTVHWLENRGDAPCVFLSVDLIKK
jgi:quercetin dioxygenase-like cupin family protein